MKRLFLLGAAASQSTFLLLALATSLAGCTKPERRAPAGERQAGDMAAPTGETSVAAIASAKTYGKPLSARPQAELAEVLAAPSRFEGKTVLVEGVVRRACSRKGCWMEVATDAADSAPGCRVTFEDYAFFVPTDSAGSHARLEATVKLTRVKASHVEHLESEGGTFREKNADGSANEVQLLATGVVLSRG